MEMPKLPPMRRSRAGAGFNNGLKPGIYETFYGNSAVVIGPGARTAWDLDAACRVPIEDIEPGTWRRAIEPSDRESMR